MSMIIVEMSQEKGKKKRRIEEAAAEKLSRKSMTSFEMRKYLRDRSYAEDEIAELIERLTEDSYIDDDRYAEEYFRYAFSKNKGRKRVIQELMRKGISRERAMHAFDAYIDNENPEFDEKHLARAEAEKIIRITGIAPGTPIPEKIKARIARRLASYGYGSGLTYDIIRSIERGELGD